MENDDDLHNANIYSLFKSLIMCAAMWCSKIIKGLKMQEVMVLSSNWEVRWPLH